MRIGCHVVRKLMTMMIHDPLYYFSSYTFTFVGITQTLPFSAADRQSAFVTIIPGPVYQIMWQNIPCPTDRQLRHYTTTKLFFFSGYLILNAHTLYFFRIVSYAIIYTCFDSRGNPKHCVGLWNLLGLKINSICNQIFWFHSSFADISYYIFFSSSFSQDFLSLLTNPTSSQTTHTHFYYIFFFSTPY